MSECAQKQDSFIEEFRKKHGRSPSILHIGNIANNAYRNAKLLNEYGFDCDVLCYDYFHIMGCPEWEDADFSGEIPDQFAPDWGAVNLQGFKRPMWFVQGYFQDCYEYLLIKHTKSKFRTWLAWQYLNAKLQFHFSSKLKGLHFLSPLIGRKKKKSEKEWFFPSCNRKFQKKRVLSWQRFILYSEWVGFY